MKSDSPINEGFRPLKYPSSRKKRKPVTYQHSNDPIGRTWLIFVNLIANDMINGDAHLFTRQFKESGLDKNKLKQMVDTYLPEYPEYYFSKTGNYPDADVYYHRWHKKSAYMNGPKGRGGIPGQSHEHITISKKLRPLVPQIETMYKSRKTLTLKEMKELGEYNDEILPR